MVAFPSFPQTALCSNTFPDRVGSTLRTAIQNDYHCCRVVQTIIIVVLALFKSCIILLFGGFVNNFILGAVPKH